MTPSVVILAAGASSRFFPFNSDHKSLHTVCGKPIIIHTLESIAQTQLDHVVVVVSPGSKLPQVIAEQAPSNLQIQCVEQLEAKGMGNAVLSAKEKLQDSFFVIHSQHLNFHLQYNSMLERFSQKDVAAVLVKAHTDNPSKYGILDLDHDKVKGVIEKPSANQAPSDQRIVGMYLLDSSFLPLLVQTPEEEYQFEAALNKLCKSDSVVAIDQTIDHPSLKYPWDLFKIKDILLEKIPENKAASAKIAETAIVTGKVIIEEDVKIYDYALIQGPVYLGRGAQVGAFSIVRQGTSLEEGAQVQRYADVRGTLMGRNSHIHSEFLGDSLIGEGCRLGAGFITANKRIDRDIVKVKLKDEQVPSEVNSLGVIMGDKVKTGIRVSTMPGTVIGANSQVGPSVTIKGTFPQESTIKESNV